jgi:2-amino-4-hydroxy-6-hydroxymethyldihydropteridine diphosphokinase
MQTSLASEGCRRSVSDFVIGLGANLEVREVTLASAACDLAALLDVELLALSDVYETDAVGPVSQPRFLNAAARIASTLSADALFERLLAIEAAHGRVRIQRWGPRTLDLDILWASEPVAFGPSSFGKAAFGPLHVPHARLLERAFALAPLLDVAPELATDYAAPLAALGGRPARYGRLVLSPGAIPAAHFEVQTGHPL